MCGPTLIGQFHERAGSVGIAEVLIDLESDESCASR
jgi:hypothetical protein